MTGVIPMSPHEKEYALYELIARTTDPEDIRALFDDLCTRKEIANMAELYFGSIAPHNPLGPISLAACLQVDACSPNFLVQEHPGNPDKSDLGVGYIKDPFVIKNGYIDVPTKPGLGVELDEEALKDKIYDGKWSTPRLYFEDGSVADW